MIRIRALSTLDCDMTSRLYRLIPYPVLPTTTANKSFEGIASEGIRAELVSGSCQQSLRPFELSYDPSAGRPAFNLLMRGDGHFEGSLEWPQHIPDSDTGELSVVLYAPDGWVSTCPPFLLTRALAKEWNAPSPLKSWYPAQVTLES